MYDVGTVYAVFVVRQTPQVELALRARAHEL